MSFSYTYSKATDFGGNIKPDQLADEIKANVGITKTLLRIDTNGDVVTIVYNAGLTGGEVTILNGIIAAHVPDNKGAYQLLYGFNSGAVTDIIYSTVFTSVYPGSKQITSLTNIKITGYLASGTSYQVRIYDVTNAKVIASGSFTNANITINSLTGVANIPSNESIFELQCKVTGTSVAYINSLTIFYN